MYERNGGENGTEMQSAVLWVARQNAWIITVVKCMKKEENRGGQLQKKCVDTFTEMLSIAMGQLFIELFEYMKKWEPEDHVVDSILSI